MFKWNLTQKKKFKKNKSLAQVNSRLAQNFTILPEEIMFKIFEKMCDESTHEIHRLMRHSLQKQEYVLFDYLQRFLGTLKHLKFTGYMLHSIKAWKIATSFFELTRFIPAPNIISEISIVMPQPETIICIPKHIAVIKLKYKMAFIERLAIMNTAEISHLTLNCVLGTPSMKLDLILSCPKLTYLHLDDFNNCSMRLSRLETLRLTTLKITGFLTTLQVEDLTHFIGSQASTLQKLTLKIRNMANMIYKLHFDETEFTAMKKLKFLIAPDIFNQTLPTDLLINVESVKVIIGWNGRVNVEDILDQLTKRPNIKTITFFGRLYPYDHLIIKEYIEKIKKRKQEHIINIREPTNKLYIQTI